MKQKTTQFLTSVAFSMAITASAVSAQTAEATNAVALDETVVVGSSLYTDQVNALKTPTPIIDVPQSLSITTADDISMRGFDSIGDIVDYTPGVSMSQGEGHRDAVVFRGVRSTADFFVDGVRDDVQYYRSLYNVEQVEILRGPNALLFGRGGAGGVLNRVTKKGAIGEDFNGYQFSIDSFGSAEAQVDTNVSLNENTAFRLNAYYNTFEDNRDFSDGEGLGVNPTLKFQLTEKTTLDVSYEYIEYDRSIDRGIPTANGKPVDALNDIVFGDPDLNKSEFEAHSIRALLQHQFSDTLKGNFTASYTNYDKLYQNFYAESYSEATPDKVRLDGYLDTTERQNLVVSGNLVSEFATGNIEHTLLFGAEFSDSSSENDRYNPEFDDGAGGTTDKREFDISDRNVSGVGFNAGGLYAGAFTDLNDDTETDLTVYSLYIQDEIKLSEELILVLGGRFDSFDINVTDNKPGGTDGSQTDEEITPRAGVVFKPQENISVYASYSQTFLPASGEQFASLGGEGFDPSEYTNLEAGVKWDLAPGYSLTAAVFQADQDVVEKIDKVWVRVDREVRGFEAQFSGQLSDQWSIATGYSYVTGEIEDHSEPAVIGNDPRELPKQTLSIWNHYQVTDKLGLGLGAIYQDSSYINDSNSAELPDFFRVDAAAYYQINENLRLQVNIENLLDEEYYPSAHSTHQASVGSPLNATFQIVGRF
ncbi:MAG: TonB-dependent siderophore receptor [Opitutae bacterium]|nr:TonB-dependent siderophore receptor [Opitutae bacterium]